jgi:hypothetical protein
LRAAKSIAAVQPKCAVGGYAAETNVIVRAFARMAKKTSKAGKTPWDRSNPRKKPGEPSKHLTPAQKRSAEASAKRAGRPYPNLVDNMRVAGASKKKSSKKAAGKKTASKKAGTKKTAARKKAAASKT